MTILAKPFGGKRSSEFVDIPDAENGQNNEIADVNSGTSDKLFLVQTRAKRLSSVSSFFLFLSALCVLFMGIIGGIEIYRAYARNQAQRMHFHGFCGVPYDNDINAENQMLTMLNDRFREMNENFDNLEPMESLQQGIMDAENIRNKFFHEEFDLDAVENVAKITVPDFRDGRSGRFLHDFQNNETAIIDHEARRCFVMPLDREHILPPQSLIDLIQKMYRGYYEINTTVVRETMQVVTPAVEDLSTISPKIRDACKHMNVYKLEKYVSGVVKRSIEGFGGLTGYDLGDGMTSYGGYMGNGNMVYDINNMHEAIAAERK